MKGFRKAQASIEFMFAIGIVLLIFFLVFSFAFDRRQEVRQTEEIMADRAECHKLSGIIASAFTARSNHTFELLKNASISVTARMVSAGGSNYPCPFPARVSGQQGNIIELGKGLVNAYYSNSSVVIKNA